MLIRDTLALASSIASSCALTRLNANPLTWPLEVDGPLIEIRHAPVQVQVRAFELGLIPFFPGVDNLP